MFDSIELRRAENGFVIVLETPENSVEYVFDSSRKAMKFIREYVETSKNSLENSQ